MGQGPPEVAYVRPERSPTILRANPPLQLASLEPLLLVLEVLFSELLVEPAVAVDVAEVVVLLLVLVVESAFALWFAARDPSGVATASNQAAR